MPHRKSCNIALWIVAVIWVGACRPVHADGSVIIEAEWTGTQSGFVERTEWVITDAARWEQVWATAHAMELPLPPAPPVDFSRSMVVGVALGEQPSGGYAVHIVEITDTGAALIATVESASPPPGGMAITIMTQPYHFVQIPRSPTPVRFAWTTPPTPRGAPTPNDGYSIQ